MASGAEQCPSALAFEKCFQLGLHCARYALLLSAVRSLLRRGFAREKKKTLQDDQNVFLVLAMRSEVQKQMACTFNKYSFALFRICEIFARVFRVYVSLHPYGSQFVRATMPADAFMCQPVLSWFR